MDTGFRKKSCATNKLERDADSQKRHPALGIPRARITRIRTDARKFSSRRDFHVERGGHPEPLDLNTLVAASPPLLFRNWSSGGIAQPKTQQVSPSMRFWPIFETAPAMQGHLITQELNVALLKLYVGCEFCDRVPINLNGFFLLWCQRRHAGKPENLLDRRARTNGAEVSIGEAKDRLLVPGRSPGRHLAVVRSIKIPGQNRNQFGPPLKQLVVEGDGAGNAAGPTLLRRVQAKQSDIITCIRVEADLGIRVVAATRSAVIFADVFHMSKHVAVPVLHHLVAEIRPKPHISNRT